MSIVQFVYIYLIGGVTFLPFLIIGFIYLHPKIDLDVGDELEEPLKAGEIEEEKKSGIKAYKSGWITVTQDYIESTDDITANTSSINDSHDNKSAYSTLYKLVKNSEPDVEIERDPDQMNHQTQPNNEQIKTNQKKHRFYGVLKHGNLFLYKNQTLKDVKHVIVLSNEFVTLWPRDVQEGQLFTKRTAICLMKKDWSRTRRLSENFNKDKLTIDDILDPINNLNPPKSSFFIHCDTNIDKEDWYFSLIRASKVDEDASKLSSKIYASTLHFETNEMIDLIQSLYSSEGQLQTKWFNALIGRIFLSLKRTEVLQNFLTTRITKKLNKIKTPGFLDKFKLGEVDPGNSIPFFTYPDLKEINPNGTLIFTSYVHYHGNLSCNISTKVNLNFGGARFAQTQVDVVLKVTLQKLEGPIIFKIKPPPSERLWYSFEIEPLMSIKIEPIISSRQMTYNIITSAIEKKFKDAIKESLVLPHWDDIVFYDTEGELFRGGIWDKSTRPHEHHHQKTESTSDSESLFDPSVKTRTSSFSDLKETRSEISDSSTKLKLTNTLSDLSKKMKKSKSTHTVGINGDNWLSDGSLIEDTNSQTSNPNLNNAKAQIGKTWKKIGDWYSNTQNHEDKEKDYQKPEMISNRRRPRVQSNEHRGQIPPSPSNSIPSYEMFSKSTDLGLVSHSRTNSKVDQSPLLDTGSVQDPFKDVKEDEEIKEDLEPIKQHVESTNEDDMEPNKEFLEESPFIEGFIPAKSLSASSTSLSNDTEFTPQSISPQLKSSAFATEESINAVPVTSNDHIERSNSKLHRKAPPPL
ncbi:nucleus-vacuole junction protein 2 [[Candida] jaroonii]|uniref:Nucleus-vacuole junction protein 2 n=1 Tax=[Candida] jaroonii TaxID=467808 RepID=A0ACA9Y8A7_9ASCO|nr:nucleus-vacuole junction protein 2 [[Candida] jaroonii]